MGVNTDLDPAPPQQQPEGRTEDRGQRTPGPGPVREDALHHRGKEEKKGGSSEGAREEEEKRPEICLRSEK